MVICDSSEDKRKDTEQESTTACQETLTMSGNFEVIELAPKNADYHLTATAAKYSILRRYNQTHHAEPERHDEAPPELSLANIRY